MFSKVSVRFTADWRVCLRILKFSFSFSHSFLRWFSNITIININMFFIYIYRTDKAFKKNKHVAYIVIFFNLTISWIIASVPRNARLKRSAVKVLKKLTIQYDEPSIPYLPIYLANAMQALACKPTEQLLLACWAGLRRGSRQAAWRSPVASEPRGTSYQLLDPSLLKPNRLRATK